MNATHITAVRELTSRSANGVHVRPLWAEPEGRCSVAVTDITTAEAFQIEVRAGERAARRLPPPLRVRSLARRSAGQLPGIV